MHAREEWRRYWGGSVQGLIDKLDYLERLGVAGVWVTPLMENVPGYVPSRVFKGWGTGYHGYWVQNYFRVNPHFGTWEDVRRLGVELDKRGWRYIQDITRNHSNPLDTHAMGRLYSGTDEQRILIDSYDDDVDPATGTRFYKHYEDTPQGQQATMESDQEWTDWQRRRAPHDRRRDGLSHRLPAASLRAFQPRRRGARARRTGLGLSIVDVIARAHGGSAQAVNRPKGGADVWLALPDGA